MHDIIREAVDNPETAWEIMKMDRDITAVVDAISDLSREDKIKLGATFKRFPLGCDLTEIIVGTCASDLERMDLIGNCILSDTIGATIHVCAYAFADIAENYGMRPVDLMREVRETTEVPLDLDHFGRYGPMRFPRSITGCGGQCYLEGPPFEGCPRERIHSRLLEKEKEGLPDRDEWVELASSVAVNLTPVQGAETHAAPLDEASEVLELARKHGKGVEAIMFVGDGYDDLISGFEAGLDMGVDVFVLEGGPFNLASDRLDAFAGAVAAARILTPGRIVATNGAYEDECRIGLRAGLNAIITGFPKNHHGYMCGYSPGSARRGRFGLPRVMKIMREEVEAALTPVPVQKPQLEALAAAVKASGRENVYPETIGYTYVGDAHWACLPSTPLYERVNIKRDVDMLAEMTRNGEIHGTVAIFGARFVSWVIAKKLDGMVDEFVLVDSDPWVEWVSVDNLRSEIKTEVRCGGSSDADAYRDSDSAIVSTTIPEIAAKISGKFRDAVTLV
ncbi:5,10-methenyltetrahydromethanopterin hydrogenase cofactor biosynthesis protein HmdC [Methanothermobacter sp. K4]|uniref:5,10-methenyltetrahydromethanopterin hydrogenase cofactor biosynthesis protein HmdC n=1 Tax=Methanothermobacter sp. K4 TaxID=2913262 RepID=UPI001EDA3141|nr:5,10-methenyltetrahydromethanopterin hydrogenase cofactor biosynthesis protein HmdC [Methanothermobacter sp. K4]MCG2828195.1 5,10-methenyltetrahydromethanopterin hydrogenase cofactor biosynthesis protein HmdC [Methanothermobacter sp. K4]